MAAEGPPPTYICRPLVSSTYPTPLLIVLLHRFTTDKSVFSRKQECEDFWSKADKNGDGQLTIQELDKALRSILPPGKGPSSKDVVLVQ
ncbi:hypothetical protein MAR_007123 [Mya arenaria]|uniref:EF-hand domain-containing protein n=1 Tax=Mya arenaria TaxID=6604 RepID=A0ABY7DD19_MYAAR|nr:hypothetical protein MAR_007123 [Mya arenaria]